jgi:PAS domain S-box-containing protein
VLVNRRTGYIEECNRKLAEFFGRLPSSLIGRHVSEFETFFAGREQYQHLLITWASGAPLRNVRIAGARPDGSVCHGLLTVEPLEDAESGQELDLVLLADISDLSRLEDQLRQAERLERIGRVAAEVAGEVQGLLEAIVESTARLQAGDPDQAAEIARASARARALVGILIPGDLPGDAAQEATPAPGPPVPRITGKETILYVDLNPDRAEPIAAFLGHLGYRVLHAATDGAAHRHLQSPDTKVDLLIAGDSAGAARLVAALRGARPELPALLLSETHRERKPSEQVDARTIVVSGPVVLADLALAVRRALTSSAASPRD